MFFLLRNRPLNCLDGDGDIPSKNIVVKRMNNNVQILKVTFSLTSTHKGRSIWLRSYIINSSLCWGQM